MAAKYHTRQKNIHNLVKTYDILIDRKVAKKLGMISLCHIFCHILFLNILLATLGHFVDSVIFYIALANIGSEMLLHILFSYSKCWRKVLMADCDVSQIISDENAFKMFSNKL